jgi:hypothetical protein
MNLFILGAGFSKPAGLPLGNELFADIIKYAKMRGLYENILKDDIASFLQYSRAAKGKEISEKQINFEEFISYLDLEHFLRLRGSDHWSDEGNRSQLVIRNLIALSLFLREEAISDKAFSLYEEFVHHLEPGDWIFTFNYDTILERAFKKHNIPYRLFQTQFKGVSFGGGEVDTDKDNEIVLLKIHGSIDWFNKSRYLSNRESLHRHGFNTNPHNAVFDGRKSFNLQRLAGEPYPEDSPLNNIYILENLGDYFSESNFITEVPLIISPSFSKLVYLNPLTEFWTGFSSSGTFEKRVAVIGFSLPEHDEYIKQPLFWLIHNFQSYDSPICKKTKLKMVDFRKSEEEIADYRTRYNFVDWAKADCYFNGFNSKVIESIFSEE